MYMMWQFDGSIVMLLMVMVICVYESVMMMLLLIKENVTLQDKIIIIYIQQDKNLKQEMRKNSEDKNKQKPKGSEKKEQKNRQLASTAIKKTKSGFAKMKKNIQHTVNAKNIMKLIKQSTRLIPHLLTRQQSKALLPKLEKIILPSQVLETHAKSRTTFQEIQDQLTHSMVLFKKTAEQQQTNSWAIDLQTQKCYKSIPSTFFKTHIHPQQLTRSLTFSSNPHQMQQTILTLSDYLDEVQYNINEQANAKIKMFMNFVMCTNSIQDLVNINLRKLAATRKHIGILRDIIVSRSVRINQQRLKKERVEDVLQALLMLKKLRTMEAKLNAQIVLGNFIPHDSRSKLGTLFNQYCQLHNVELNKFCCKGGRNLCKYWDVTYYVERGFQQNFIKITKSYLFELINTPKHIENFKRQSQINKKNFMTTPSLPQHPNLTPQNQNFNGPLDESFQIDATDHVQLITRVYIQKQIVALFQQGMHKYSFSTDGLEKDLKQCLAHFINAFLKDVLKDVDNQSRLTLKDLNEVQEFSYFQSQRCKEKIGKAQIGYFNRIVDTVMLRFQYLSIRLLSLLQKLLKKASQLQQESPQRYQVFTAYTTQLISTQLSTSDLYISSLLRQRLKDNQKSITLFKSKEQIIKQYDVECETMKKLVRFCNKWINLMETLQRDYHTCWFEFQKVQIQRSQKKVGQVGWNRWCVRVQELKGFLVKSNYQMLHKTIVTRDLKDKLEEDRWQYVEIKTYIYNDLGYILGGKQFLLQQQRTQRESLPKSILMDKSQTECELQPQKYPKQQYSSRFKINPSYITLQKQKLKLTSSTECLIQFLRKYLQLYDDITVNDSKKKSDLQGKLTELVLMYNQYIKDLILKGQAVKLDRIKTKSITAKHLVVAYVQLEVVGLVFAGEVMEKRVGFGREDCTLMRDKIGATQNQIRKKYQKIIQMRIMDSIESINLKDESWLDSPFVQSIPNNIESSIELFSEMTLNEKQYQKFIDMDPNWVPELLNKVGKGPKGRQNKMKCFAYLMEQIRPFLKYLPKLSTAIKSILN